MNMMAPPSAAVPNLLDGVGLLSPSPLGQQQAPLQMNHEPLAAVLPNQDLSAGVDRSCVFNWNHLF